MFVNCKTRYFAIPNTKTENDPKLNNTMKKIFLSIALLVCTLLVSEAAVTRTAGPSHKVVLSAAKYLMKLYNKDTRSEKQVNVPQLNGYSLVQVALINEGENQETLREFDYVAVYQQKGSTNLKVVLYNNQSQEQLALESVKAVSFGSENDNTRVVLQRADATGELATEVLFVPGTVQVARKG